MDSDKDAHNVISATIGDFCWGTDIVEDTPEMFNLGLNERKKREDTGGKNNLEKGAGTGRSGGE